MKLSLVSLLNDESLLPAEKVARIREVYGPSQTMLIYKAGRPLNAIFSQCVEEMLPDSGELKVGSAEIISAVCAKYELMERAVMVRRSVYKARATSRPLTRADLTGPCRERVIVWPRQEAMWLMRRYGRRRSLPLIGRAFGNRNHTTVLHAVRAVNFRLVFLDGYARRLQALIADIGSEQYEPQWRRELKAMKAITQYMAQPVSEAHHASRSS